MHPRARDLNDLAAARERYPSVFTPLKIRHVEIPNRIVFPPMAAKFANEDGSVSDRLLDFYTAIAKGGAGMVITGSAGVTTEYGVVPGYERLLTIATDDFIPGLKRMVEMIRGYGSVVAIQIVHAGRGVLDTGPGCGPPIGPSAILNPVIAALNPNYKVRAMVPEDIERVREDFIRAGLRCFEAGADVVELHGAHGYLLMDFMNPRINHRTDEYGGSPENRARLVVEILRGLRAKAGESAVLGLRVSGKEFIEGGLEPEDLEPMIPMFEDAGLDLLHVSVGSQTESVERSQPGPELGEAPHADIAHQLKQAANIPVIAVGSILSLETAESVIASGKADLAAMGRAQVADHEIVRKSAEGRNEEIRECEWCGTCFYWLKGDPEMYCSVNPVYRKKKQQKG